MSTDETPDPVPVLSVVVVTYRRADLLEPCLKSLERAIDTAGAPTELLVIDTGSQPAAAELMKARFTRWELVPCENIGFAGAVTLALERTSGDWVALFNDDVTVESDSLEHLLEVGRQSPGIGSVAPQIRFDARRDTINSAGVEVDQLGMACDRLVDLPTASSETEPTDVFGASGGAALYRRAMLDDVGGFDASFFAYLEDVDVAWRAQMRGWRAVYAPRSVVYHHHSASFEHGSSLKHFLVGRNRVVLLAKNADRRQLCRYGLAMAAYDLAYVTYVGVTQRTLAPLRGRLNGLTVWRRYRGAAGVERRPLPFVPHKGLRAALRRHRAWPSK
jgi:GT2 family glycosyltransferase